jgi:transposase
MATIGHDVAEELRFVPGHFERHEYQREKLACGTCKDGVVTAGEGPLRILPRSAASASAIARVVVGKYADHLPLTRQHGIYKRDGVLIPVSTMADWVAGVADMLEPIVDEISRLALASYVLQGDSTGLPVLDPKESAANIRRGTMWCYVGDERNVVFRYTPTGEGQDGPWTFLRGREGYFQADAANMFDRVFDGQVASAIEVGCLAHLRRKFVALQDVDSRVAYPIKLINRLYRFETLADAKELDTVGRQLLRAERAPPVLEKLRRYCLILIEKEPPSGKLAQAARYAINHWTALTRFVDDGRLQLDNNLCERQLRTVALTRKNALFAGSHDAARRMAIIYSVLRTCALHGADPLAYLTSVLEALARGVSPDRIPDLLPDRWLARQS